MFLNEESEKKTLFLDFFSLKLLKKIKKNVIINTYELEVNFVEKE